MHEKNLLQQLAIIFLLLLTSLNHRSAADNAKWTALEGNVST